MNDLANVRDDIARNGPGASTEAVADFIKTVGERVRKSRMRSGMSRRTLSESSGVSQRYLAQLESGEGNISIALLYKVAHALGHRVAWFVGDEDRNARQHRICLIGVRGAGKSTLGRMAAESLAIPFVELNEHIEEQSGVPVDEVIALYGPEGFRELELQALKRVVASTVRVIVAVAGGIVSEPDAYNFLLENFHTIWLKATPEEHMNRVRAQGDYRPMAGNPQAMEELQSILTDREALYTKADRTVNTSGKNVQESLNDVLKVIVEMGMSVPLS